MQDRETEMSASSLGKWLAAIARRAKPTACESSAVMKAHSLKANATGWLQPQFRGLYKLKLVNAGEWCLVDPSLGQGHLFKVPEALDRDGG